MFFGYNVRKRKGRCALWKKMKWWMIPLVILAVILLVLALFWPTLKIYLAPKTVLTVALTDTYGALQQRMANSPVMLLSSALDLENGNTIDLELDTANDLLGSVRYDMTVQAQWKPRRILAQGQASTQGKQIDLSVFLDKDFAALSSASILQGNYYGLTYDTFAQDIRSNKLLSLVIGDTLLGDWESRVDGLEAIMEDSWEIPTISEDDLSSILVGILALKAEVEQEGSYYIISFKPTGAQIAAGMDYLHTQLPISLDGDEEVEVSFWLYENAITKIDVDTEELDLELHLGNNAATDDLMLRYENAGDTLAVTVRTSRDASHYRESITISAPETVTVDYSWDLTTGAVLLTRTADGTEDSVSCNLSQTPEGFRLETADFEALMHLLLGTGDSADSPCVLTVGQGNEFATPAYKNFADWSLDDMITLAGGVGSLFGFHIG